MRTIAKHFSFRAIRAGAAVLAVLAASSAFAVQIFVAGSDPNADDKNAGTLAAPFKTIQAAVDKAQPGDVVLIHAGRYGESVTIRSAGTADHPIRFKAFADDAVLMDGADEIPADKWQPLPGSKNIFFLPAQFDPGQVLVDGKPVYVKVNKVKPYEWELDKLGEQDKNVYQFDASGKRLLVSLGGEKLAGHSIRVPVRPHAILLGANCRLSGIRALHYAYAPFVVSGDDAVVEDCLAVDCGGGVVAGGLNRRGAIIRRNTVIGALGCGIYLIDRPTGCLVEDNLVIRATLNPWHLPLLVGSIKMNGAADIVFAHNVVIEPGNPDTIGGWDGEAMWGDGNIVRVMYLGNVTAHAKHAGLYIEAVMGDTRAYFNTSYHDDQGITCRASQRGVFMRNYIESPRGSGLAVWHADEPYPTVDNVFAHNLVRQSETSLHMQTEHPNVFDYNVYWPRKGSRLAVGETKAGKTPVYKDLDEVRKATGHELHGEVRDAQPEDLGLGTVTFRVADARNPDEVLSMIGNGGCEFEDPAGVNLLPYFWRAGTGDGAEHVFGLSIYYGLGEGDNFAFSGAGGTVALQDDWPGRKHEKLAHSGWRCLEIVGRKPAEVCPAGLGFWSPSLPVRPGDTFDISLYVRGKDLKPLGGTALAAFVEFSDASGQHVRRQELAAEKTFTGTFGWTKVPCQAKVPADARRMKLFLGARPTAGTLMLDDITIKVRL
jgi:hypothetical protein